MRIQIQNKITEICQNGTFAKVTYGKSDKLAVKSDTEFLVPAVAVNEVSGTSTDSKVGNARSGERTMSNWQFEAHLKFTSEVDTYYFLTEQLKRVSFTYGNTRAIIRAVGQPVEHPPRQGSHAGTQLVLTFSVTTRR